MAISPFIQSAIFRALERRKPVSKAWPDRPRDHPARQNLSARLGRIRRPAAVDQNRGRRRPRPPRRAPTGPAVYREWSKESGPGEVRFADPKALITTATFSTPGAYVLRLTVDNGTDQGLLHPERVRGNAAAGASNSTRSTPRISRSTARSGTRAPRRSWSNWIPHCIDQINRTDLTQGPGGIDNFVEAGKKLRGEPHGAHKGYVFSNAWVHQTVEAMSIALMIDPQGDPEIVKAHDEDARDARRLDPEDPRRPGARRLSADRLHADRAADGGGIVESSTFKHWDPPPRRSRRLHRRLLPGIGHQSLPDDRTRRTRASTTPRRNWPTAGTPISVPRRRSPGTTAIRRWSRRWCASAASSTIWRAAARATGTSRLAKFLLDCRYTAAAEPDRDRQEYDQSHLPVTQQYEAVGHAVRAVYTYSGMADVAVETHDPDYQSAVKSLWDNIVNKKYYVTGGVGSGETSEGFGPNYSLRNDAYCESCSSCGEIFFQWKMNLAYHDAKYADLYEETMYNALLGRTDLEGKNFYYTNPLDANDARARPGTSARAASATSRARC